MSMLQTRYRVRGDLTLQASPFRKTHWRDSSRAALACTEEADTGMASAAHLHRVLVRIVSRGPVAGAAQLHI